MHCLQGMHSGRRCQTLNAWRASSFQSLTHLHLLNCGLGSRVVSGDTGDELLLGEALSGLAGG